MLPAGASGGVDVTFAPDAPYRLALGRVLLALLLLVAAVVPDRARRVDPPAGDPGRRRARSLVAAGRCSSPWSWPALGALAAGLALSPCGYAARMPTGRWHWRSWWSSGPPVYW